MTATNYLHYDAAGHVHGVGYTPDGTIPADCLPCTPEQAQNWQQYAIDLATTPPSIVAAPASVLLGQAQAAQIQSLSTACRAQIGAGFDSAALGATHHYPAGAQDQANLTASVTASLIPNLPSTWTTPFWCHDSAGNWTYADHSAVQIQQAGSDGKTAVTTALKKNESLAKQVMAIGTEPGWTAGATIAGGAVIQAGGRRYQANATGGTAGSKAPAWPIITGAIVTDGTLTWTDLGTLIDGVQAIVW